MKNRNDARLANLSSLGSQSSSTAPFQCNVDCKQTSVAASPYQFRCRCRSCRKVMSHLLPFQQASGLAVLTKNQIPAMTDGYVLLPKIPKPAVLPRYLLRLFS